MSEQDAQQTYKITCLSPRKDSRYYQELCNNGKNSVNTIDTHYSWNSCEEQIEKTKVHTFKKMKEGYLRQKNNEGKVVKQRKLSNESPTRFNTIERLDDAVTIYSENSPRSVKSSALAIEESIIIMSGQNVEVPIFAPTKVKLSSPHSAELFKRRAPKQLNFETKANQLSKKSIQLIFISSTPRLVMVRQIGWIFYCEKQNFEIERYKNIFHNELPGILKMFSVSEFNDCKDKDSKKKGQKQQKFQSLVLYEPFDYDLTNYILMKLQIGVKQFLKWISEIIDTLIDLCNEDIFPDINSSSIVVVNQAIKIILRPSQNQRGKKEMINSLGVYMNAHFKEITKVHQGKGQKIKGLNIFSKMQIQQIIQNLLKKQNLCLIEVNEKISKIIQTY